MLHLTNPCAVRKVLGLTKLKGKIYKTKSLGNYITYFLYSSFRDCSERANHGHFHIPSFLFLFTSKIQVHTALFTFFYSYSVVQQFSKVHNSSSSFLLLFLIILLNREFALSAGAVEYTDCISAEG